MKEQINRLYEFDEFQVEVNERRLMRGQEIIPITPKAFDTLLVLLRSGGKIVEKDTLLGEVWTDTFVSEATLAQNISTLRKALGTTGNGESLIETVPRRGYRFKAEVREINGKEGISLNGFEKLRAGAEQNGSFAPETKVKTSLDKSSKPATRRKPAFIVAIVCLILILAGIWLALGFWLKKTNLASTKFANFQISQLTSSGNVITTALSPDGNYLAYVEGREQNQVLLVKQTSGENILEIVPPKKHHYLGLTFSPSGDSIYFVTYSRETVGVVMRKGVLYKVPTLGGVIEQIAEDFDSAIEFSPDKKQMAFVRNYVQEKESAIIVADSDGGNERKLAARTGGERFSYFGAAWSPDGKSIASSVQSNTTERRMDAIIVDVSSGEQKLLMTETWSRIGKIGWLADGSGILFAGYKDNSQALTDEIWLASYPSGETRLITNGINTFSQMSLTADSGSFASIKTEQLASLCTGSLENPEQASKITRLDSDSGLFDLGLDWASDGRIFYGATRNGNIDIWRINSDGEDIKQLTSSAEADFSPVTAAGGERVIFLSARSGQTNLWRMSADGANPKQLTNGYDISSPSMPDDSKWIYFLGKFDERQNVSSLWKTTIEGDAPVNVIEKQIFYPKVSPDGKFIAGYFPEASAVNSMALKLTLFSAENGEVVRQFAEDFSPTQLAPLAWTADNLALVYVKPTLEGNKLKMQTLAETEPRFLLQQTERVFKFALSKTGNKFICARGVLVNDAYLIRETLQK